MTLGDLVTLKGSFTPMMLITEDQENGTFMAGLMRDDGIFSLSAHLPRKAFLQIKSAEWNAPEDGFVAVASTPDEDDGLWAEVGNIVRLKTKALADMVVTDNSGADLTVAWHAIDKTVQIATLPKKAFWLKR